jgi:hypothetical protein
MSLEQALAANTAAIVALTAQLAAGATAAAPAPVAPSYPPPAPAPQHAPPPVAPVPQFAPPAAPAFPPAQQAPAPSLPFHDNASASTWATDNVYQAIGRVAPDNAIPEITLLMQQLGISNFDMLTPDKYPTLYQLGQALLVKYGIAG